MQPGCHNRLQLRSERTQQLAPRSNRLIAKVLFGVLRMFGYSFGTYRFRGRLHAGDAGHGRQGGLAWRVYSDGRADCRGRAVASGHVASYLPKGLLPVTRR